MNTPTVGTASNQISEGFIHTRRTPSNARHVLTTVAACANPNVEAIPARSTRPSENEIAVRITIDWRTPAARIATSTPRKLIVLSGSLRLTSETKSTAATLFATGKLGGLDASFNGDWRGGVDG